MSYLGPETEILHERYAEALIDIAEEAGKLDEVADNLGSLNELVREDEHLGKILQHPEVETEDKLKVLEAVSDKARFGDEFRAFLRVLARKDRLNLIHGVFLRYSDLYEAKRRKARVLVRTAVSLSKEETAHLKKVLSRAFKKEIIVEESIQPSLIGGIDIRAGDSVYNLSLTNRLNFMEERLK